MRALSALRAGPSRARLVMRAGIGPSWPGPGRPRTAPGPQPRPRALSSARARPWKHGAMKARPGPITTAARVAASAGVCTVRAAPGGAGVCDARPSSCWPAVCCRPPGVRQRGAGVGVMGWGPAAACGVRRLACSWCRPVWRAWDARGLGLWWLMRWACAGL